MYSVCSKGVKIQNSVFSSFQKKSNEYDELIFVKHLLITLNTLEHSFQITSKIVIVTLILFSSNLSTQKFQLQSELPSIIPAF